MRGNSFLYAYTLLKIDHTCMKPLGKILKKLSNLYFSGYTNWNNANHWIDMDGAIASCDTNGNTITSFDNLTDDLPIPDYTKLID